MGETDELISRGDEMMDGLEFESALGFFERALALDPDNADLWNRRGVALRGMGRYEEAVRCFERSLEIEPRDRDAS